MRLFERSPPPAARFAEGRVGFAVGDIHGRADLLAELTLLTMNVEYQNLGYLSVRNVMPLRDDRLDRLLTTGGTIVPSGRYEFCPNGDIVCEYAPFIYECLICAECCDSARVKYENKKKKH